MEKEQALQDQEQSPVTTDTIAIVEHWFVENFYNQSLPTEHFNFSLAAKDDLIRRLKGE